MHARLLFSLMLVSITPSFAQEAPAPAQVNQVAEPTYIASYGKDPVSIVFTPQEAEQHLNAIFLYERDGLVGLDLSDEEITALEVINTPENEVPENLPPINYPNFQLTSIIYQNPNSWFIHINGIIINASTNNRDNELYVAAINKRQLRLIWTPQEPRLIPALQNAISNDVLPQTPEPYKHRLVDAARQQPAMYAGDQSITFVLEPNQFFASSYMKIFEGRPDDLPLPQISRALAISTGRESLQENTEALDIKEVEEGTDAPNPSQVEKIEEMISKQRSIEAEFLEENIEPQTLEEQFMELMNR